MSRFDIAEWLDLHGEQGLEDEAPLALDETDDPEENRNTWCRRLGRHVYESCEQCGLCDSLPF